MDNIVNSDPLLHLKNQYEDLKNAFETKTRLCLLLKEFITKKDFNIKQETIRLDLDKIKSKEAQENDKLRSKILELTSLNHNILKDSKESLIREKHYKLLIQDLEAGKAHLSFALRQLNAAHLDDKKKIEELESELKKKKKKKRVKTEIPAEDIKDDISIVDYCKNSEIEDQSEIKDEDISPCSEIIFDENLYVISPLSDHENICFVDDSVCFDVDALSDTDDLTEVIMNDSTPVKPSSLVKPILTTNCDTSDISKSSLFNNEGSTNEKETELNMDNKKKTPQATDKNSESTLNCNINANLFHNPLKKVVSFSINKSSFKSEKKNFFRPSKFNLQNGLFSQNLGKNICSTKGASSSSTLFRRTSIQNNELDNVTQTLNSLKLTNDSIQLKMKSSSFSSSCSNPSKVNQFSTKSTTSALFSSYREKGNNIPCKSSNTITFTYSVETPSSVKQKLTITMDDPYCALKKFKDRSSKVSSLDELFNNLTQICNSVESEPCRKHNSNNLFLMENVSQEPLFICGDSSIQNAKNCLVKPSTFRKIDNAVNNVFGSSIKLASNKTDNLLNQGENIQQDNNKNRSYPVKDALLNIPPQNISKDKAILSENSTRQNTWNKNEAQVPPQIIFKEKTILTENLSHQNTLNKTEAQIPPQIIFKEKAILAENLSHQNTLNKTEAQRPPQNIFNEKAILSECLSHQNTPNKTEAQKIAQKNKLGRREKPVFSTTGTSSSKVFEDSTAISKGNVPIISDLSDIDKEIDSPSGVPKTFKTKEKQPDKKNLISTNSLEKSISTETDFRNIVVEKSIGSESKVPKNDKGMEKQQPDRNDFEASTSSLKKNESITTETDSRDIDVEKSKIEVPNKILKENKNNSLKKNESITTGAYLRDIDVEKSEIELPNKIIKEDKKIQLTPLKDSLPNMSASIFETSVFGASDILFMPYEEEKIDRPSHTEQRCSSTIDTSFDSDLSFSSSPSKNDSKLEAQKRFEIPKPMPFSNAQKTSKGVKVSLPKPQKIEPDASNVPESEEKKTNSSEMIQNNWRMTRSRSKILQNNFKPKMPINLKKVVNEVRIQAASNSTVAKDQSIQNTELEDILKAKVKQSRRRKPNMKETRNIELLKTGQENILSPLDQSNATEVINKLATPPKKTRKKNRPKSPKCYKSKLLDQSNATEEFNELDTPPKKSLKKNSPKSSKRYKSNLVTKKIKLADKKLDVEKPLADFESFLPDIEHNISKPVKTVMKNKPKSDELKILDKGTSLDIIEPDKLVPKPQLEPQVGIKIDQKYSNSISAKLEPDSIKEIELAQKDENLVNTKPLGLFDEIEDIKIREIDEPASTRLLQPDSIKDIEQACIDENLVNIKPLGLFDEIEDIAIDEPASTLYLDDDLELTFKAEGTSKNETLKKIELESVSRLDNLNLNIIKKQKLEKENLNVHLQDQTKLVTSDNFELMLNDVSEDISFSDQSPPKPESPKNKLKSKLKETEEVPVLKLQEVKPLNLSTSSEDDFDLISKNKVTENTSKPNKKNNQINSKHDRRLKINSLFKEIKDVQVQNKKHLSITSDQSISKPQEQKTCKKKNMENLKYLQPINFVKEADGIQKIENSNVKNTLDLSTSSDSMEDSDFLKDKKEPMFLKPVKPVNKPKSLNLKSGKLNTMVNCISSIKKVPVSEPCIEDFESILKDIRENYQYELLSPLAPDPSTDPIPSSSKNDQHNFDSPSDMPCILSDHGDDPSSIGSDVSSDEIQPLIVSENQQSLITPFEYTNNTIQVPKIDQPKLSTLAPSVKTIPSVFSVLNRCNTLVKQERNIDEEKKNEKIDDFENESLCINEESEDQIEDSFDSEPSSVSQMEESPIKSMSNETDIEKPSNDSIPKVPCFYGLTESEISENPNIEVIPKRPSFYGMSDDINKTYIKRKDQLNSETAVSTGFYNSEEDNKTEIEKNSVIEFNSLKRKFEGDDNTKNKIPRYSLEDSVECTTNALLTSLRYLCAKSLKEVSTPCNTKLPLQITLIWIKKELTDYAADENPFLSSETIARKLKGKSHLHIAKYILDILEKDPEIQAFDEKSKFFSMTTLQKKFTMLIVNISHYDHPFEDFILTKIEQCVASFSCDNMKVEIKTSLAHIHTLICKKNGFVSRSRALLFDIMYTKALKAYPIAYRILVLWPNILPKYSENEECLLGHAIAQIIIKIPYFWKLTEHVHKKYCVNLLKQNILYRGYNKMNYEYDALFSLMIDKITLKGNDLALLLLCRCQGFQWAISMLERYMIPVFGNWENTDEDLLAKLIVVTGQICRGFPHLDTFSFILKIINIYERILNGSSSIFICDATVEGLALLKKHNLSIVAKVLACWKPKSNLLTQNCVVNIKSVLNLKNMKFWNYFIDTYSSKE